MPSEPSTILFIHGSADLYGADIILLQLVAGLNRDRFRSLVIVPYDGALVPHLREAGAEVIVWPDLPVLRRRDMNVRGFLRLAFSLRTIYRLIRLIRERDVAVVHSNTLAVVPSGIAAKLSRCPQLWHVHEIIVHPRIGASLLATLSSAFSDLVVACSQATASHYRRTRLISSTPVKAILNGIDESRARNRNEISLRSLLGIDSKDTVFALLGRINHWKGHPIFLDTAEYLAAEFKNVSFLIAGDSFAGQEQLTEAVDRRIKSSEILRRRMFRLPHMANVGSVYEASDTIIVPSIEPDPFSTVVLEAMAAGLPVIATRIGGVPEAVVDNITGLLVDPNNVASLLAAMKKLVGSPSLRAEMGSNGRDRFKRNFGVARFLEEFNEVYEELQGKDNQ